MLVSGIKSRPQYGTLEPDPFATFNLVLVEGEGVNAAVRLLKSGDHQFWSRTTVLCVGPPETADPLSNFQIQRTQLFPTIETLLIRLDGFLGTAVMGIRLYAGGTEGFIGQIIQHAGRHFIDHKSIITEHCGSLARRVQCVHCKGVTENVTTNVAKCSHCGVDLLIRDHYSRRFAAFMGVSIDAEAPGVLPPIERVFP
jgi:dimethylamine monooxygenase subunit C